MHDTTDRSLAYYFTKEHKDPYDACRWVQQTVEGRDGEVTVTFPDFWSISAIEGLVRAGFLEGESDVHQTIDRLVNVITKVGYEQGYFAAEKDADIFCAELKYLLVTQRLTFDADVWSTVGKETPVAHAQSTARFTHEVSDLFMRAVEADGEWRALEAPKKEGKARQLWQDIVRDVWRYSDTRVVFASLSEQGDIVRRRGSDYVPAAALQMEKFIGEDNLKQEAFGNAVSIAYIALDILTQYLQLETDEATEHLRYYRPINLSLTGVASSLLSLGIAYESKKAKAVVTAWYGLLAGRLWAMSMQFAEILGPFVNYESHTKAASRVLRSGYQAATSIEGIPQDLQTSTIEAWQYLLKQQKEKSLRNSAIQVNSSTFMDKVLDSSSSGLRPLTELLVEVSIASGGKLRVVRDEVASGLKKLGYDQTAVTEIINQLHDQKPLNGISQLKKKHYGVFNAKHPHEAAIGLTGAIQPFSARSPLDSIGLSGGASLRDVERLLTEAWYAGITELCLHREGTGAHSEESATAEAPVQSPPIEPGADVEPEKVVEELVAIETFHSERKTLPLIRQGKTFAAMIDGSQFYLTVNELSDGTPGELLITTPHASLAAVLYPWARSVSIGLQHGVPLDVYLKTTEDTAFAPYGNTDDPEVPMVTSVIDYIGKRLSLAYNPEKTD